MMSGRRSILCILSILLIAACALQAPALAYDKRFADWATVSHPRHGFQIAYPGNVFAPAGPASDDGQVFVSRDGSAKLVVAAFANDQAVGLIEYRAQLLSENYKGAHIDYGPRHQTWFVVSGTQGDMHFYERVSFTCEGRMINSWALLYPASQRQLYDRAVEAIARTYSPGAGQEGQCGGL